MPRRTYRYPEGLGFEFWNALATIGSFLIALSILVFLWNAFRTRKHGEVAGPDPWDGRTLEWTTSSPPPEHNFDRIPVVEAEDDFWHRKYETAEDGTAVAIDPPPSLETEPEEGIHLPSPSLYPFLASAGLFVAAIGLVYVPWGLLAVGVGAVTMMWGLFGWSMEPLTREEH